jgi:cellulose synthase/poly-beta-1,6-N-acetylglucosamine synthase-like glycosyltransferase
LPDRALVIVPTYNEKENIERMIDAILKQDASLDVLVVDDGSPDGTGDIVDRVAASNPRVFAIHRAGKLGLGTAYEPDDNPPSTLVRTLGNRPLVTNGVTLECSGVAMFQRTPAPI